jgi:DNA-binding transcriptional ArsR family regulator
MKNANPNLVSRETKSEPEAKILPKLAARKLEKIFSHLDALVAVGDKLRDFRVEVPHDEAARYLGTISAIRVHLRTWEKRLRDSQGVVNQ